MDFVSKVKQIMNDVGWSEPEYEYIGSDSSKLDTHIRRVFPDAWKRAVKLYPKNWFNLKDLSVSVNGDIASGVGWFELPTDYYGWGWFKMNGWFCECEELADSNTSVARRQSNDYVRGSIVRPVCVRRGNRVYYYSLPKGKAHVVAGGKYIPMVDDVDDAVIGERLIAPLAYLVASMVYLIFEKHDMAKQLEDKALSYGAV